MEPVAGVWDGFYYCVWELGFDFGDVCVGDIVGVFSFYEKSLSCYGVACWGF